MTEKDILYRCEQNFLNPDDEHEHTHVCKDCGGSEYLCIFGDEILCADCIEDRLVQNSDDCVAGFLEENSVKFQEFIWDYFGHVLKN